MDFRNIKGVFFDLGYTLIEYGGHDWRMIDLEGHKRGYDELVARGYLLPPFGVFHERLEELKTECRPADRESLKEWKATDAPAALLAEFGVDDPAAMSALFIRMVYTEAQKYMQVCEGGVDTLRGLKERGFVTGIISNTLYPPEFPNSDLARLGLQPYLDITVYSSEIGYRKPHPADFEAAANRSGLEPQEIIYIGDRFHVDVLGAREAGMVGILKYRPGMIYPDPLPIDIPVLQSIHEILSLTPGVAEREKT
jgi:HAD superfamily hydrolase (TIGR01549 family)